MIGGNRATVPIYAISRASVCGAATTSGVDSEWGSKHCSVWEGPKRHELGPKEHKATQCQSDETAREYTGQSYHCAHPYEVPEFVVFNIHQKYRLCGQVPSLRHCVTARIHPAGWNYLPIWQHSSKCTLASLCLILSNNGQTCMSESKKDGRDFHVVPKCIDNHLLNLQPCLFASWCYSFLSQFQVQDVWYRHNFFPCPLPQLFYKYYN